MFQYYPIAEVLRAYNVPEERAQIRCWISYTDGFRGYRFNACVFWLENGKEISVSIARQGDVSQVAPSDLPEPKLDVYVLPERSGQSYGGGSFPPAKEGEKWCAGAHWVAPAWAMDCADVRSRRGQ